MCGIFGVISNSVGGLYNKDETMLKELMIVNSLRGAHSTGLFGGSIDDAAEYAKAVGGPYEFLDHPKTQPFIDKIVRKFKYVVGHGRHATRGKITGNNAHPFQVENITMVHNGTVLNSGLVDVSKHDVDSLAIAHALAKHDAVDVFKDINGAYAIVYHDAFKRTLNFVRNKDRPLYLGINKKEERLFFSSEKNMLITVAMRNGFSFDDVFLLPEDTLFTFSKGSLEWKETTIPKDTYHRKIVSKFAEEKEKEIVKDNVTPISSSYAKEGRIISVTSQITKKKFEVGEVVSVKVKDVHQIPVTGANVVQMFASCDMFPEAEFSFIWKGRVIDLPKNPFWKGKIVSISGSSSKNKKQFLVYLNDTVEDDIINTFDGTKFTLYSFREVISNGCTKCKKEIKLIQAEDVLVTATEALCPECTMQSFEEEYDKLAGSIC